MAIETLPRFGQMGGCALRLFVSMISLSRALISSHKAIYKHHPTTSQKMVQAFLVPIGPIEIGEIDVFATIQKGNSSNNY